MNPQLTFMLQPCIDFFREMLLEMLLKCILGSALECHSYNLQNKLLMQYNGLAKVTVPANNTLITCMPSFQDFWKAADEHYKANYIKNVLSKFDPENLFDQPGKLPGNNMGIRLSAFQKKCDTGLINTLLT